MEDIAPPPRSRFLPPKASRRVRPSPPCRANRPPPARLRQSRLALSRQKVVGRLVLSPPSRPPPAPWRPARRCEGRGRQARRSLCKLTATSRSFCESQLLAPPPSPASCAAVMFLFHLAFGKPQTLVQDLFSMHLAHNTRDEIHRAWELSRCCAPRASRSSSSNRRSVTLDMSAW